ncbi:GyrI-like domain-containing protein [Pleionea sp. CnH1-48]|uniref:GyrI-like domain-containing protein n=1 Tax=Pleionea sp. CnH1-48 TaxID=2954494 RepID=UPI002096E3F0|nr:GyrI-like domain-containing protein [Pleionea sp. CnH1-48]MCO7224939.1 GyrI-like domain-containing protein [Pleionea sp. CnH1-48]
MSLPQHNPFLRGLYLLLVIIMFIFMMMVIRAYWPDAQPVYPHAEGDYYAGHGQQSAMVQPVVEQQTDSSTTPDATASSNPSSSVPKENMTGHSPFKVEKRLPTRVVGIAKRLQLNQDIESQVEQLWMELYKTNLHQFAKGVQIKNQVYMVYRDYNQQRQSVEVVVGYSTNASADANDGFYSLAIPGGNYMVERSVLATWKDPRNVPLAYRIDYEVYDIDQYFQVASQRAFLSIR